jgi:hypothetical protein
MVLEAEKDRNKHHGDSLTKRTPHHQRPAAKLIQVYRWEDRADEEHGIDNTAQQETHILGQAHVLLQHRGDIVDDEIDTLGFVSMSFMLENGLVEEWSLTSDLVHNLSRGNRVMLVW